MSRKALVPPRGLGLRQPLGQPQVVRVVLGKGFLASRGQGRQVRQPQARGADRGNGAAMIRE